MNTHITSLIINAAAKLAFRASLGECPCPPSGDTQSRTWANGRWPDSGWITVAMVLTALPGRAIASEIQPLLAASIAFGISGVLIIQALIGVMLVMQRKYISKDPSHFIAIAVAFLLIGTISVLSEVTYLTYGDFISFLALICVPAYWPLFHH